MAEIIFTPEGIKARMKMELEIEKLILFFEGV
jgi:hypothetical protein